ncbi:MAG TPA: hypothetical protein VN838_12120 [Bradyrhizobium sp.]|nr:hypothetical protein [Bradyrhizobium sp.]
MKRYDAALLSEIADLNSDRGELTQEQIDTILLACEIDPEPMVAMLVRPPDRVLTEGAVLDRPGPVLSAMIAAAMVGHTVLTDEPTDDIAINSGLPIGAAPDYGDDADLAEARRRRELREGMTGE